jgi:hypothetical protein
MDDFFVDNLFGMVDPGVESADPFLLSPELLEYDSTSNDFFSLSDSVDFDACLNDFDQNSCQTDLVSSLDTSLSTSGSGTPSPSITDSSIPEDIDSLHPSTDGFLATSSDITSLICGFQSCCFDAPDWDTMVLHRQQKHSRSIRRYPCSKCTRVFSLKTNRDRHFRYHSQISFYCPDCLNWAPLRRKDSYNRHRKTRHSETSTSITPPHTSPPRGYQRLMRGKKETGNKLHFIPYVV